MKVLPTPVCPIKTTGRASFNQCRAVEFFDLRFANRATGGEVDIFERGSQGELGGFDAIAGFTLLPIIGLGLQQCVEALAVARLIAGRIVQSLLEGCEHAEQFHLGHHIFGDSGTHRSKVSWVEGEGVDAFSSGVPAA
jgi:hypothetical protein